MSSSSYLVVSPDVSVREKIRDALRQFNADCSYLSNLREGLDFSGIFSKLYEIIPLFKKVEDHEALPYRNLLDIWYALEKKLPELYSELYKLVEGYFRERIAKLQKSVYETHLESQDQKNIVEVAQKLSATMTETLHSQGLAKGAGIISLEVDIVTSLHREAVGRRKSLQQKVEQLSIDNEELFRTLEELGNVTTPSLDINKIKGKILEQAREAFSRKLSTLDFEDLLEFEKNKHGLLFSLYQEIEEVSERGTVLDQIQIRSELLFLEELMKVRKKPVHNERG